MLRTFGTYEGRALREVTLDSGEARAAIVEYGAVVRDLEVRRPDGRLQRVVLGLETVDDYVRHAPHFGAIAGRVANRIRDGRFTLDGTTHQVVKNQDGKHHLHGGGPAGFGKQPWTLVHHEPASATLVHVSPAGTSGYPGTVTATCRYRLAGPTLAVELVAVTDAPTLVNMCQHSYFNLDGSADILDHTLQVDAEHMTPVDGDLIPTGAIAPVAGTPFDFRAPRPVRMTGSDGKRVWYDHNFVLRRRNTIPGAGFAAGLNLARAARFAGRTSGLAMEVWTTAPGLHVYDGFKVDVPVPGLGGVRYGANAGLCLETQVFPDAPNNAHFPSAALRPGEVYRHAVEYRFLAM